MSLCFSDYAGYFCRYWGSNAVQGKTDISEDIYMLCVETTIYTAPDSGNSLTAAPAHVDVPPRGALQGRRGCLRKLAWVGHFFWCYCSKQNSHRHHGTVIALDVTVLAVAIYGRGGGGAVAEYVVVVGGDGSGGDGAGGAGGAVAESGGFLVVMTVVVLVANGAPSSAYVSRMYTRAPLTDSVSPNL